ncbi:MAG: DUF3187 family protein [Nitrospinota bacterium]|nr:DUF3187 family protein [Nitrospinota bacterium]
MNRVLPGLALGALILAFPSPQALADDGQPLSSPIRSRNHHPIFVNLLNPPPEEAAVAEEFTWEIAVNHSSIFIMGANNEWYIHMDKEMTEYDFSLRAALPGLKMEVGAEIPFFMSSSGFMDSFVRTYHSTIGVEGYDYQDHFPDDFYVDKLYRGQKIFYLGRDGRTDLGDITLWLKGEAYRDGPYLLSWQAFAQPPTGKTDVGAGSGLWEYGARVLTTGEYTGLGVYLMLGAYVPGGMKGLDGETELIPMFSGFLGFEWTLWDGWAFLAQLTGTSSPMSGDQGDFFSKPWFDSTIGFKKLTQGGTLAMALSENVNQTAPDFTIHLSFKM